MGGVDPGRLAPAAEAIGDRPKAGDDGLPMAAECVDFMLRLVDPRPVRTGRRDRAREDLREDAFGRRGLGPPLQVDGVDGRFGIGDHDEVHRNFTV
jgi:hypothetical protein